MKTVLVCGGRDYDDPVKVHEVLHLHAAKADVIEGGADGADRLAREWALANGKTTRTFPADWAGKGKAAGPIRNQLMLDDGKPDLVIAFPGGKGTEDMVARAKKAGVDVIEVEE